MLSSNVDDEVVNEVLVMSETSPNFLFTDSLVAVFDDRLSINQLTVVDFERDFVPIGFKLRRRRHR